MTNNQNETQTLIGSDKVNGMPVYGAHDQKIGSIERVMIDKKSGRISYAVLGFGGFLGIGNDYYPLPWDQLNYDEELGGYRAELTKELLQGAPRYAPDRELNWSDSKVSRSIYDYYGGTRLE